jgi:hypothetical protein
VAEVAADEFAQSVPTHVSPTAYGDDHAPALAAGHFAAASHDGTGAAAGGSGSSGESGSVGEDADWAAESPVANREEQCKREEQHREPRESNPIPYHELPSPVGVVVLREALATGSFGSVFLGRLGHVVETAAITMVEMPAEPVTHAPLPSAGC